MFDGSVCVSDAIAMLTVLAYVLHMRRDVARVRCVHANCDAVAMKVAHLAAVSTAGPRLGVSGACLLKHNRALPNLFVAR